MILDAPFPPDARVENEAQSLIEAGNKVFLFSLHYNGRDVIERIRNIEVHKYRSNTLIYKLSALAYTLPVYHYLLALKIKRFIKETNPDVLHIHDMVVAEAVFAVNKEYNLPIVLDLHENRPEIMKYYQHVNTYLGKLLINLDTWKKKQNILMQKATKVILVTPEAKEVAMEETGLPSEKFYVVPNTITPSIFYNYEVNQKIINNFKSSFNILYLGDTGLRRGTDTALKAVAKLKDKIPNVKLILVGKSSADSILKSMATKLNINENVAFMGWQNLELFPSFIKAADICISPLKRNLHHDTTFANKLFQYMAMGKPVVVSDCPSQANLVKAESCGLVHKAESPLDLAEKIYRLYKDRSLLQKMGNSGKQAVDLKYAWDLVSKPELMRIYSKNTSNK